MAMYAILFPLSWGGGNPFKTRTAIKPSLNFEIYIEVRGSTFYKLKPMHIRTQAGTEMSLLFISDNMKVVKKWGGSRTRWFRTWVRASRMNYIIKWGPLNGMENCSCSDHSHGRHACFVSWSLKEGHRLNNIYIYIARNLARRPYHWNNPVVQ